MARRLASNISSSTRQAARNQPGLLLDCEDAGKIYDVVNNLDFPMPKRLTESVPADKISQRSAATIASHQGFNNASAEGVRAADGYAGDISPVLAFQWWKAGEAVLVDVRTDAEREWVGFVPGAVSLAWKQWPGMAINSAFGEGLKAVVPEGKKVVLLCRSGVRSVAAAKLATALGLLAYNILDGFEGDPDSAAHRGQKGGWRYSGLPWQQN